MPMSLMKFEEMKKRYDEGCDSLELTLEKWERILQYCKTGFCLNHFQEVLRATTVPIFLCAEYANQCHLCPIFAVCRQGHAGDWQNLMRVVQAYAIAGDLLPRDTLIGHLEQFVQKLNSCKQGLAQKFH